MWPDPVSPCCIFTVSPGIAATVTTHQAEIERERGAVRAKRGMGGRKTCRNMTRE